MACKKGGDQQPEHDCPYSHVLPKHLRPARPISQTTGSDITTTGSSSKPTATEITTGKYISTITTTGRAFAKTGSDKRSTSFIGNSATERHPSQASTSSTATIGNPPHTARAADGKDTGGNKPHNILPILEFGSSSSRSSTSKRGCEGSEELPKDEFRSSSLKGFTWKRGAERKEELSSTSGGCSGKQRSNSCYELRRSEPEEERSLCSNNHTRQQAAKLILSHAEDEDDDYCELVKPAAVAPEATPDKASVKTRWCPFGGDRPGFAAQTDSFTSSGHYQECHPNLQDDSGEGSKLTEDQKHRDSPVSGLSDAGPSQQLLRPAAVASATQDKDSVNERRCPLGAERPGLTAPTDSFTSSGHYQECHPHLQDDSGEQKCRNQPVPGLSDLGPPRLLWSGTSSLTLEEGCRLVFPHSGKTGASDSTEDRESLHPQQERIDSSQNGHPGHYDTVVSGRQRQKENVEAQTHPDRQQDQGKCDQADAVPRKEEGREEEEDYCETLRSDNSAEQFLSRSSSSLWSSHSSVSETKSCEDGSEWPPPRRSSLGDETQSLAVLQTCSACTLPSSALCVMQCFHLLCPACTTALEDDRVQCAVCQVQQSAPPQEGVTSLAEMFPGFLAALNEALSTASQIEGGRSSQGTSEPDSNYLLGMSSSNFDIDSNSLLGVSPATSKTDSDPMLGASLTASKTVSKNHPLSVSGANVETDSNQPSEECRDNVAEVTHAVSLMPGKGMGSTTHENQANSTGTLVNASTDSTDSGVLGPTVQTDRAIGIGGDMGSNTNRDQASTTDRSSNIPNNDSPPEASQYTTQGSQQPTQLNPSKASSEILAQQGSKQLTELNPRNASSEIPAQQSSKELTQLNPGGDGPETTQDCTHISKQPAQPNPSHESPALAQEGAQQSSEQPAKLIPSKDSPNNDISPEINQDGVLSSSEQPAPPNPSQDSPVTSQEGTKQEGSQRLTPLTPSSSSTLLSAGGGGGGGAGGGSLCGACRSQSQVVQFACLTCGGVALCGDCRSAHRNLPVTRGHEVVTLTSSSAAASLTPLTLLFRQRPCCPRHGQDLALQCCTCAVFLCHRCLAPAHLSHEVRDLGTLYHSNRKHQSSLHRAVKQHLLAARSASRALRQQLDKIDDTQTTASQTVTALAEAHSRRVLTQAQEVRAEVARVCAARRRQVRRSQSDVAHVLSEGGRLRAVLAAVREDTAHLTGLILHHHCQARFDTLLVGCSVRTEDMEDVVFCEDVRLTDHLARNEPLGSLRPLDLSLPDTLITVLAVFNTGGEVSGLATTPYNEVVTVSLTTGLCRLWDQQGAMLSDFSRHVHRPCDVSVTPAGVLAVLASDVTVTAEAAVEAVEVEGREAKRGSSSACLAMLSPAGSLLSRLPLAGHSLFTRVHCPSDSHLLVSDEVQKTVTLYSVEKGSTKTGQHHHHHHHHHHPSDSNNPSTSNDGRRLRSVRQVSHPSLLLFPRHVCATLSGDWLVNDKGSYLRRVSPDGQVSTILSEDEPEAALQPPRRRTTRRESQDGERDSTDGRFLGSVCSDSRGRLLAVDVGKNGIYVITVGNSPGSGERHFVSLHQLTSSSHVTAMAVDKLDRIIVGMSDGNVGILQIGSED